MYAKEQQANEEVTERIALPQPKWPLLWISELHSAYRAISVTFPNAVSTILRLQLRHRKA